MTDGKNFYPLPFDVIQDTVNAPTLAIEKLADALAPKAGLRGQGVAVRRVGKAFDSVAEAVEPFSRRGFSEKGVLSGAKENTQLCGLGCPNPSITCG
jgi:hypothetical protein